MKGNLKADYDVIVMAAQNINRAAVLAAPAARPQPYQKSDKYKFLGMYGETPDMSGGFGQAGVTAFEQFLDGGGTLITTLGAIRFPIEFGFAHSIDTEPLTGVNAQKPLVHAEIMRTDHPVFYGYQSKTFPIKFEGNTGVPRWRRRPGQRAGPVRRRRFVGAERPDGRRRQHQAAGIRHRRAERAQRQGTRASCSRTTPSTAGRTTASSTWCSTRSSTGTTCRRLRH